MSSLPFSVIPPLHFCTRFGDPPLPLRFRLITPPPPLDFFSLPFSVCIFTRVSPPPYIFAPVLVTPPLDFFVFLPFSVTPLHFRNCFDDHTYIFVLVSVTSPPHFFFLSSLRGGGGGPQSVCPADRWSNHSCYIIQRRRTFLAIPSKQTVLPWNDGNMEAFTLGFEKSSILCFRWQNETKIAGNVALDLGESCVWTCEVGRLRPLFQKLGQLYSMLVGGFLPFKSRYARHSEWKTWARVTTVVKDSPVRVVHPKSGRWRTATNVTTVLW